MTERADFIKHGSANHAALLGLKKAVDGDKFICEGFTLSDVTQFGPTAREDYIQAQLVQRVAELKTAPSVPVNAQPMWVPPVQQL